MGFFDRLFGRKTEEPEPQSQQRQQPMQRRSAPGGQSPEQMTDEQAVERYRYMLKTAPPDAIEQAHAEAFSRLTPEQRQMVLQELTRNAPENERATSDDPQSLARMATRAEMRQPGTLERTFSGVGGGGMGMGGMGMGSLFLTSMAGMFVGSMIANQFFGHDDYAQGYNEGYAEGDRADDNSNNQDGGDGEGDTGYDSGDTGDVGDAGNAQGDYGTGDYGGNDYGGSDFGGSDFGGGDFGGGDF